MTRDLSIPNRLAKYGLAYTLIPGWEGRGKPTLDPKGSGNHHTAGPRAGTMPSLGTLINGRSDLPGPLANVGLGRDLVFRVIASGKANHFGYGHWKGIEGNSHFIGLEVEHTGTNSEPVTEALIDAMARFHAAMADGRWSAEYVAQHWEYAEPHGRKNDFLQSALDASDFRKRVAAHLARGGAKAVPPTVALPPFPGITLMEGMGYTGKTNPAIESAISKLKFCLHILGYNVSIQGDDLHKYGSGTAAAVKKEQEVHNYLASLSKDPKVRADQWAVTGIAGPKSWDWIMRRARDETKGK